jgi:hypothetical protein
MFDRVLSKMRRMALRINGKDDDAIEWCGVCLYRRLVVLGGTLGTVLEFSRQRHKCPNVWGDFG